MLSHIKAENLEELREQLSEELGKLLKAAREIDPQYRDTAEYAQLQEIKGHIFDETHSIHDVIMLCENTLPTITNITAASFIKELISLSKTTTFQTLFEKDKTASLPSQAKATLFSANASQHKTPYEIAIAEFNKEFPGLNIGQFVELVMSQYIAKHNNNYHGYFINSDAALNNYSKEGLELISNSEERLVEILRRQNQLLFDEINRIIKTAETQGLKRIQFIISNGEHFLPLDIDISSKSCFIFDAAGDFRKFRFHEIAKYIPGITRVFDANNPGFVFEGNKRSGGLQKSSIACPLFALYMSEAIASISDIHQNIAAWGKYDATKGIYNVDWTQLPPAVIQCAQSTEFIKYYISCNPNTRNELMQLTNNNQPGYTLSRFMDQYKLAIKQYISEQKSSPGKR